MFFSRGVNRIQNPYTLKDFYASYIKDIEGNPLYDCKYLEYVEIVSDFYKAIADHILKKSGFFHMPYKLGRVSVMKKKIDLNRITTLGLDWKLTNEFGKNIYHLNEHSDGFKYGFQWDKAGRFLKYLYFYRLIMTRANKRELARLIKSGNYDFYEKD